MIWQEGRLCLLERDEITAQHENILPKECKLSDQARMIECSIIPHHHERKIRWKNQGQNLH